MRVGNLTLKTKNCYYLEVLNAMKRNNKFIMMNSNTCLIDLRIEFA